MDGWMDDRQFGYKPTALEWHQRTTNEKTPSFLNERKLDLPIFLPTYLLAF
jgi:hypothetical protein